MDKIGFKKYLENKDLAHKTISEYLRLTELFFAKTKKEEIQVTKPDVLNYLEHLKNKGLQNITRQMYLLAVNHYFTFLYKTGQIATNPCSFLKIRGVRRKKLYKIYTSEELEKLYDAYNQLFVRNNDLTKCKYELLKKCSILSRERNMLILSILFNQGITTKEIDKIEINDIDFMNATLKIRGGKKLNDRTLPIKATQIGLFMNYLQNIRPQIVEYQKIESNKLFLLLPSVQKNKLKDESLMPILFSLTKQIQSIEKQFINFQQVRASIISFWIKTQGLRKAQYMAGHRYICNTERYVTNNLDGLIDDINKLNPFDF